MPIQQLLIIGFVWPEPNSTAAGSRMLQLIHLFQSQNFDITFASSAKKTPQAFPLHTIGVQTVSIELNATSFDEFIMVLQPQVVLFDRFMTEEQFGWRVAEHCPNALRILDTEDFHGLRTGRAQALKANTAFSLHYLQNAVTKREVASIYRCDLSLMISEVEIDILSTQLGVNPMLLYYLPFTLKCTPEIPEQQLPTFTQRKHFICIGNGLHAPNYDAIQYLKNVLWPLIKGYLPNTQLHIYGAYISQRVSQLHNKQQGFIVKGYADDVGKIMSQYKVHLAPLRFGAGLKGKLIDAMRYGTPTVMSTIAAEGMFGHLQPNGYIEDNPELFTKQVVTLYNDENIWKEKQQYGFVVLKNRFEISHFEQAFKQKIDVLYKNLQQYRAQNFTGQLLMHHTLQSTKYMSKWIEAKHHKR